MRNACPKQQRNIVGEENSTGLRAIYPFANILDISKTATRGEGLKKHGGGILAAEK